MLFTLEVNGNLMGSERSFTDQRDLMGLEERKREREREKENESISRNKKSICRKRRITDFKEQINFKNHLFQPSTIPISIFEGEEVVETNLR